MRAVSLADAALAWTPWPVGVALVAVTTLAYLWWWARARRAGRSWPWWRLALYLVLGVGTLAYSVCGPLQVDRDRVFWVAALQVGVLSCVTPVGLALGDPLRLRALSRHTGPLMTPTGPVGWVLRVLMFPAVSSVVAVGSIVAVFFSPYFQASLGSAVVEAVLIVHLLATGLLFVLPLLVGELLPGWAGPGVRTVIAFADGLLDAVPGVALLTTEALLTPAFPGYATGLPGLDPLMEQRIGGGVLLAVSEAVGLPLIAAVILDWVRADRQEAAAVDAALDAAPDATLDMTRDTVEPGSAPGAPVLWWQTDPRFADRYPRRPSARGNAGDAHNTG